MKKYILFALVLTYTYSVNSQTKTLHFKAKDNEIILNINFSKSGDFFIETRQKRTNKLFKFNQNLENIFKTNLIPIKKAAFAKTRISYNGHYFTKNDRYIIDESGKSRNFNFEKKTSGNIIPKFKFISNTYQGFIGHDKKHKKSQNLYIFTRQLSDFKTSQHILQDASSTIVSHVTLKKGAHIKWSLGEQFDDYFNMLTKDDVNPDRTIDVYHVVSYNYDGTIKSYVPLKVTLDTGHIMMSVGNGGPVLYHSPDFGGFSPGNVHTDRATGDMYVYGYYTDVAKKNMVKGKFKGFYVHKFSPQGKLLWKQSVSFDKKGVFNKTYDGSQVRIYQRKINSTEILIQVSNDDDELLIVKLNSENGKRTFSKSVTDFKYKSKEYNRPYINKNKFSKKYFSYLARTALYLNKDIYTYISTLNPKTKMYINAVILNNGTIFLYHYDIQNANTKFYDTVKIVKFN